MKPRKAQWAKPRERRETRASVGALWQSGGLLVLGALALGMTAFPDETLSLVRPLSSGLAAGWGAGLAGMSAAKAAGSAAGRLVRNVVTLGRESAELQRQVQSLEQRATLREEQARELVRLRRLLQLKDDLGGPSVAARVIGGDPSSNFGSLLVDAGAAEGVREGQAVVCAAGAVGRVVAAAPGLAHVLWLCDPRSRVAAYLQRSRVLGVLVGTGRGVTLKYLAAGDDVKVGDRVLTAGRGSAFPKGILVGLVKEVRREGLLLSADIVPAVDVDRLEEVLVLTRPSGSD